MTVDVSTETLIHRPPSVVSAYAGDPNNAPKWYVNIRRIEWKSAPPLRVGSRVAFVANFLGPPGARLVTPLMSAAMRRANRKDLERLKTILEG